MKKLFTTLVVGLLLTFSASAQYVITTHTSPGQNPGGLNNDAEQPGEAGYVNIIAPSTTIPAASWSAVQTIPFNFDFNGSPVTQYKVSSTGVLTFTTSATTVPTDNNVALPSTLIPDKSIMVWGLQQRAGNDVVRTKTFGSAPFRQHWIYFASFSTPQSPGGDWTYWGIVLEESTNKIFVVDMRTYLTPISLTIGIQVNGTTAYQVASAPNTPSFVTNGGSAATAIDNMYYEFAPPSHAVDVLISNVNTFSTAIVNSINPIVGTAMNNGTQTIDTLEISWSADGGQTIHTDFHTGLNLATSQTYNFSHSVDWQAINPGQFTEIKVWTNLPTRTDGNLSNDTLTFNVFVNTGATVNKKALLEEFTTAPCQYCPDGAVVVENILAQNTDVIAVGLHACFGTDAMTIPEASAYCAAFSNAAPTATIDRVLFPGESQVGISRNIWQARANSQAALGATMSLNINGSYNSFTRQVNVTVTTNFVDYPIPGDLSLTLFVVEDSVVGSGPGYNQVNAYNTQFGHPYYNKGNPIVGYVHKHVLRDVYPTNNAWGDNTVFTSNIQPNDQFTKNYTFTLNTAWDADQVSLVAFVSNYDMNDVTNREVLNAEEVKLNNLIVGLDDEKEVFADLNIYPNPFKAQTNVNFTLKNSENVSFNVMDVTGKLVHSRDLGKLNAGNHIQTINADELESGFYFIRITVGEQTTTRKISVIK